VTLLAGMNGKNQIVGWLRSSSWPPEAGKHRRYKMTGSDVVRHHVPRCSAYPVARLGQHALDLGAKKTPRASNVVQRVPRGQEHQVAFTARAVDMVNDELLRLAAAHSFAHPEEANARRTAPFGAPAGEEGDTPTLDTQCPPLRSDIASHRATAGD
jgi:hypothetical protein